MTIEAEAIVGLILWLWAHESQHSYEKHRGSFRLAVWIAKSLGSAVVMVHAFARVAGWVA